MEEAPRALFAIGRPGESPAFLPVEVLELTVQALAWVSAESSQAAHKALFVGPKAEESMTRALLRLRARLHLPLSLRLDNHARLITALRRDIERIQEERPR